MTERERLIEFILECDKSNEVLSCFNERPRKRQAAEIFADCLLANGVIVPPCKVGDWVWHIRYEKPSKAKIEELQYSASKHGYFSDDYLFHAYDFKEKEEVSFWRDDIGKTVFLSRELAEKALAERSNG